jgi:hypothetical protein
MRKKNRNYRILKRVNYEYFSAINRHGVSEELVTRLKDKKNHVSKLARSASNESTKANLRAKNAFFNTVNATMTNYEISAKKKFSILTKLMKNQKISNIPPLIQNDTVIIDAKSKSEHLNDIFVSKASVQGSDDPVPVLDPITSISSTLSSINTSPIEVSKVLRQLKKSNYSHCGIFGQFVIFIATPISFSLSRMFNNCFEVQGGPFIWPPP